MSLSLYTARTVMLSSEDLTAERIAAAVDELRDAAGGGELDGARAEVVYGMRYSGQAFELPIPGDPDPDAAGRVAAELDWEVGDLDEALACDVVCTITPGHEPVVRAEALAAGRHLNLLGADGPGKAEATPGAVASCTLFCDEWEQAVHGGELTGAVAAGLVERGQVTELGAVLAGEAPGRPGPQAVTLFDSTGLAIQDLAVAAGALEAWRAGRVEAQTLRL